MNSRMNVESSTPARANTDSVFLTQEAFVARLRMEQRRTERSRRPFVLMLLESETLFKSNRKPVVCDQVLTVLSSSLRETDVKGWHENGCSLGIIFTEIGSTDDRMIGTTLVNKVRGLLSERLKGDQINEIKFSFFLFPQDWDKESRGRSAATLYPENGKKLPHLMKRALDIAGSLSALIVGSPLFLAIAIVIKLTSKGPILFRQERVGRYGRTFTFLKFRSMDVNNNHAIHREFVKSLISGSVGLQQTSGVGLATYKLTNDPRVTAAGRILRKTSLDELPQFLNVLKGEMSLVGPRPPIPYEVENYDIWHRRRLLAVKPGITGLWQVRGRNRTTFDEMVRMDLHYAKSWSIWLDLKILLQTPRAVVDGNGAC
jgi:lipopolysaccharide/colanic/teichoic acid biosynthesis glycosyltransferase